MATQCLRCVAERRVQRRRHSVVGATYLSAFGAMALVALMHAVQAHAEAAVPIFAAMALLLLLAGVLPVFAGALRAAFVACEASPMVHYREAPPSHCPRHPFAL